MGLRPGFNLDPTVVGGRRIAVGDPISGRVAWVPRWFLRRLVDGDPAATAEADAAGWTRRRSGGRVGRGWQKWLAIRISLVRCESLVERLSRPMGWFLSATAVRIWTGVAVAAAWLLCLRCDRLFADLAMLPAHLAGPGSVAALATLIGLKAWHELGHAAACHRSGARPGRAGVLLLAGFPCPFVDVTDSTRLDAGRRFGVMAAGMYLELVAASVAVFVWAAATETSDRLTALGVAAAGSVTTLVFNANPLMRYDGHHMLADAIGSIDLRREARECWSAVVSSRVWGWPAERRRGDARAVGLALFHAASNAYRVVVLLGLIALLVSLFDAAAMSRAGRVIAVGVVSIVTLSGVHSAFRTFRQNDRSPPRRWLVGGAGFVLVTLAVFTPIPRWRTAAAVLDFADRNEVYLPVDGRVTDVLVHAGDRVRADRVLVSMDGFDGELALATSTHQWRLATASLQNRRRRAADGGGDGGVDDRTEADGLASDRMRVRAASDRRDRRRRRHADAAVRAGVDGVVLSVEPDIGRGWYGSSGRAVASILPDVDRTIVVRIAMNIGDIERLPDPPTFRLRLPRRLGGGVREVVGQVVRDDAGWGLTGELPHDVSQNLSDKDCVAIHRRRSSVGVPLRSRSVAGSLSVWWRNWWGNAAPPT